MTGLTNSTDFPTMNPLQPANGGDSDAFVAEFNPEGRPWSTPPISAAARVTEGRASPGQRGQRLRHGRHHFNRLSYT